MVTPKGNLYTIIAFDPDGNPVALRMNADGELMTVVSGGGGSGTPAVAQGRLITPVVFDPDGKPVGLEVDQYGQLSVVVSGLVTPPWTQIERVVLTAETASIDFQSIPATYNYLFIQGILRSARDAELDSMRVKFNNDGGANYNSTWMNTYDPDTIKAGDDVGGTAGITVGIPAATASAGRASSVLFHIPEYKATTFHKTLLAFSGRSETDDTGGDQRINNASVTWKSTAAITRITMWAVNDNLVAGSTLTLYGII